MLRYICWLCILVSFLLAGTCHQLLAQTGSETISIQVNSGWNMLSLPLTLTNGTKSTLFPAAISDAYIYQGLYQSKDTLQHGLGFWLKFDSSQTISISGNAIYVDTVQVQAGWNMIASLSVPIAVSTVHTEPPDITTSSYFKYTIGAGYQATDTIQSGNGYWIKVKQDGIIILSAMGVPCPGIPTVDYAGKSYNTVRIGDQCWLRENLDVGTMIQGIDTSKNNGIIEKYCFNNDPTMCDTFGGLYMWSEAMQYISAPGGVQGICPSGWHIPTPYEFQTLSDAVGGNGNTLLAVGQGTGTNISGFSALLGGYITCQGCGFADVGDYAIYNAMDISYDGDLHVARYVPGAYPGGGSVRCIKGDPSIQVFDPYPPDNKTAVDINTQLTWSATDPEGDPLTYDVYFGIENPPITLISSNQTDTNLVANSLNHETTYYWRVVANDNHGNSTTGPIWRFTTAVVWNIPCPGISTVEYSGKTYHTVQIKDQCWLKENLDIGTMIQGNQNASDNDTIQKYCYNNDTASCNVYGGFYQWNEAMQYSTTPGTKGICPTDWHIPTSNEFQILKTAVGGDRTALLEIGQGDGTNTSGFSSLLSGSRGNDNSFRNLGFFAYFWSSTKYESLQPFRMFLSNFNSIVYISNETNRTDGYSVRCVKDYETVSQKPELSTPADMSINISMAPSFTWNTSTGATSYNFQLSTISDFSSYIYSKSDLPDTNHQLNMALNGTTTYYWRVSATNNNGTSEWSAYYTFTSGIFGISCPGTPTVEYAGETYHTVLVGNQCWLKENLNVGTMIQGTDTSKNNGIIEKYCYANNQNNCITYGGLYYWDEAMQYSTAKGAQGICPGGWHMPTLAEFLTLKTTVGGDGNTLKEIGQGSGIGAGTNTSGFSALLAGYIYDNYIFEEFGKATLFLSSEDFNTTYAYYLYLSNSQSYVSISGGGGKEVGGSVRCIKD